MRKLQSSEESIRIVLSGVRGADSLAELCPRKGLPVAEGCQTDVIMGVSVMITPTTA
ncbi:hypothetical protein GCM10010873_36650 [Cypionkella aquatica]|uniref:Uncharacterized protein n=1 Tax=Cypionkella aquatica TaxID=1756042 RepID=A0AA37UC83_9RHOB|nr:hypothetical protein GCM10010873_36650 [Cypionkella aquatica]